MEAQDILAGVCESINASQRVSLAGSEARSWTATLPGTMKGEELFLDAPASYPAHILRKRPRVSFCTAPDAGGMEIHGNGIARVSPGTSATRLIIAPYRFVIFDSARNLDGVVIERRRNAWQIRPKSNENPTGRLSLWLQAARPVSFPLSVLPVVIGTALAFTNGRINWLLFILALIGGVAAHAATNLISDYHDFIKGIDTTNALSSHVGVLVDELIEPTSIALAAMVCFLITAFIGGVLTVQVGWPIVLFGLAGMLGGFAYSGGPTPWKYIGLGELSTGFLMGPLMVTGAYFVQTHTISLTAILLSVAIGLLVSAISFGNNLRDTFIDAHAGVTTLPVNLGAGAALGTFRALLVVPYLLALIPVLINFRLFPLAAVLISLPKALSISAIFGGEAGDFATLSKQATGRILPLQVIKLHQLFCILLLAGIAGIAIIKQ